MFVGTNDIDAIPYSDIMVSVLNLIPFISYINSTRASLNNIYLSQAVCRPTCTYDNTVAIVPEYDHSSLFVTDSLSGCDPVMLAEIPDLNFLVMLMNIVSASKRFKYRDYHRVSLSVNDISVPDVGHILPSLSRRWGQKRDDGMINTTDPLQSGSVQLVIRTMDVPVKRDNFKTLID